MRPARREWGQPRQGRRCRQHQPRLFVLALGVQVVRHPAVASGRVGVLLAQHFEADGPALSAGARGRRVSLRSNEMRWRCQQREDGPASEARLNSKCPSAVAARGSTGGVKNDSVIKDIDDLDLMRTRRGAVDTKRPSVSDVENLFVDAMKPALKYGYKVYLATDECGGSQELDGAAKRYHFTYL